MIPYVVTRIFHPMGVRREHALPRKSIQISRRDFLRLSGAGLAGATLLGVAGCGGGGTIQGGGGGGGGAGSDTFVFGRGADSVSLDPVNATDGESLRVTRQIFDGLLDFAPETHRRNTGARDRGPRARGRRAGLHLQAQGRRQVPRRRRVQRRGRQVQLRPLARQQEPLPHGRRGPERRTSPTTWASSEASTTTPS